MGVSALVFVFVCVWSPEVGAIYGDYELSGGFSGFNTPSTSHKHTKYRPVYHVTSPLGFLNAPAAFIKFHEEYHLFYQYRPYEVTWGYTNWGHVVTDNLVDWMHYPAALFAKEYYEKQGCLSGSAILHNDYLTVFYTGNLNSHNLTEQNQNIAISSDGVTFQKYLYNPVIKQSPFRRLSDFRNPKVWSFRDKWYMLVSSMSDNEQGQLLLYISQDLFHWTLNGTVAESYGDMGYMWEHPDIFELDGFHVLLFCARGVQTEGFRFRNLYQSGYMVGTFNYLKGRFNDGFEVSMATYNMLDYGHDFYAPTTLLDGEGRRLLIAWLGMWDSNMEEARDGWHTMMTIVRHVTLDSEGRLLMAPVREMADLRDEILENAWYSPGEAFYADCRAFEMIINTTAGANVVRLVFVSASEQHFAIEYTATLGSMSVNRGGEDGYRRADWSPPNDHVQWRIFMDYSSIEVFAGKGEVVFSSRIFPRSSLNVLVEGDTRVHVVQYRLRRSISHRLSRRQVKQKMVRI